MKTPRVKDFDPDAKVPSLKSSLDSMPTIQKPKTVITPPSPTMEKTKIATDVKAVATPQKAKTTNNQQSSGDKFQKYSTYLRPGYKKELKSIALEHECKDYEILDEALTLYIKNLKK